VPIEPELLPAVVQAEIVDARPDHANEVQHEQHSHDVLDALFERCIAAPDIDAGVLGLQNTFLLLTKVDDIVILRVTKYTKFCRP